MSSTIITTEQAVGSSDGPSFIAMVTGPHRHGYLGTTCHRQCVSYTDNMLSIPHRGKPHFEPKRKPREGKVIYYFYNCVLGQTQATVTIYKFYYQGRDTNLYCITWTT